MNVANAHAENPSFPAHARQVVRALRGAFSELLLSIGADPHEPQGVSRQLGINKNLAWKISKIVQSDDPSITLEQMPGLSGIRILIRALEKAGAEPKLVATAEQAVEAYEQLIKVHSGDRATLEIMGSTLSPRGRQSRDEQHRKLLFQGASYVWGVQARAMVKTCLVGPNREAGYLDLALMNGLIDFRRLRPDVAWTMAMRKSNYHDGSGIPTSESEPIDEAYARENDAPLMAEFCSQPLPELRRVVDGLYTSFELVDGPVGNTGALTCVAGTIQRRLPGFAMQPGAVEWGEHSANCDTPAELLILDLMVHEKFDFAIPPESGLYGQLSPARAGVAPEHRTWLPLHEPLHDLGVGPLPVATVEVPRYNEMVRAMFDRTGWNPEEFHGFRVKVAYPACPTVLVLRYPLPQK